MNHGTSFSFSNVGIRICFATKTNEMEQAAVMRAQERGRERESEYIERYSLNNTIERTADEQTKGKHVRLTQFK